MGNGSLMRFLMLQSKPYEGSALEGRAFVTLHRHAHSVLCGWLGVAFHVNLVAGKRLKFCIHWYYFFNRILHISRVSVFVGNDL